MNGEDDARNVVGTALLVSAHNGTGPEPPCKRQIRNLYPPTTETIPKVEPLKTFFTEDGSTTAVRIHMAPLSYIQ